MKRIAWFLLVLAGLSLSCRPQPPTVLNSVDVHFSPRGGCTEAVVREIDAAKESIFVQAYSFTSAPIAKALVDAHRRGVKVEVILDASQKTEKYSSADFLVHMGVPTRFDAAHAIAHNKVMVLDGAKVITGSFNFTKSAEERNAENLLVIVSPALAAQYTANWQAHAAHSEPYAGKDEGPAELPENAAAETAPPERGDAPVGYYASVNSGSFHRPGCRSVGKIAPQNLIQYSTRDEAIAQGKKPCGECKP